MGSSTNIDEFYTLILPYREKLLTIAKIKIGNVFDAEDALEDTLIKAFENFHKLRSKDKIYPWVKRILINHCNDLFRYGVETPLEKSILEQTQDSHGDYQNRHDKIETMEKF
jgi:DNA-directed RNA polymerase specialized sigma24 family protein